MKRAEERSPCREVQCHITVRRKSHCYISLIINVPSRLEEVNRWANRIFGQKTMSSTSEWFNGSICWFLLFILNVKFFRSRLLLYVHVNEATSCECLYRSVLWIRNYSISLQIRQGSIFWSQFIFTPFLSENNQYLLMHIFLFLYFNLVTIYFPHVSCIFLLSFPFPPCSYTSFLPFFFSLPPFHPSLSAYYIVGQGI